MRRGVVLGAVFMFLAGATCVASLTGIAVAAGTMVSATAVSATERQQFSGQVGTLSPCTQSDTRDTVTINWGDGGATSTGAVMPPSVGASQCEITSAHTYAEEGSYPTQVTVMLATGSSASGSSTATVADAPISLTPQTLAGTAGNPTSGVLTSLSDAGALEPSSDYMVTIEWGDGQASPGTVDGAGNVSASHTYASPGTYSATVTASDDGGQNAHATVIVSISAPSQPPCVPTTTGAAPPFSPTVASPNARWVQALYHDLLGRPADAGGLTAFTGALDVGATRDQVVLAFEAGAERRAVIVGSLYNQYLRRSPGPAELNGFEQFVAGGGTDEQLGAILLGSSEYMITRGGGTNDGVLSALYCDALNRSIDPPALHGWEQAIANGTTRQQVAQALLSSPEYRGDLVEHVYLRFLRRIPSPTDRALWTGQLNGGATDEQVTALLLSSQEYFHDFAAGTGTLLNPTISRLGVIRVTLRHRASLDLVVLRLLPAVQRRAAAAPVITGPKTRRLGIVSLGRHQKGRVTIHWNRKVTRRRLKPGRYVLLLEARAGRKLRDVSDALTVTLR
jgi:PKD domain/Domain of unknown function (DUF4214)